MNQDPRQLPRSSQFMRGALPLIWSVANEDFARLARYAELVASSVDAETHDINLQIQQAIDTASSDEEAALAFDPFEERYDELCRSYPTTLRSTVLATACSLLEGSLHAISRDALHITNMQIKTKDKGIRRSAKILRDTVSIHINSSSRWNTILDYYKVRDCFIHASGDTTLLAENHVHTTMAAIQRLDGVSINSVDELVLEEQFPISVLEVFRSFWEEFGKALMQNRTLGERFWP